MLRQSGGHIAYQVIPSKRRKGYMAIGLKLCLDEAAKLGLDTILVTCQEGNIASYKTMHRVMVQMGGYEDIPSDFDGHQIRRVWISCPKGDN